MQLANTNLVRYPNSPTLNIPEEVGMAIYRYIDTTGDITTTAFVSDTQVGPGNKDKKVLAILEDVGLKRKTPTHY